MKPLLLLAQDPTAPAGAFGALIQLGAVGGIAALLLWFAFRAYQAERARADRLEAKLYATLEAMQDKVVPALLEATAAVKEGHRERRDPR
jgi:hypothetical protein